MRGQVIGLFPRKNAPYCLFFGGIIGRNGYINRDWRSEQQGGSILCLFPNGSRIIYSVLSRPRMAQQQQRTRELASCQYGLLCGTGKFRWSTERRYIPNSICTKVRNSASLWIAIANWIGISRLSSRLAVAMQFAFSLFSDWEAGCGWRIIAETANKD